jgi:two-component sensor histidine kinase
MRKQNKWIHGNWSRLAQHILFWLLSFFVFLNLFKIGNRPEKIDYVYTGLFHLFILPPVYLNLFVFLPALSNRNNWKTYLVSILVVIPFFSGLNYYFFSKWSNHVLPDYFFISYFQFLQVCIFFVVYLALTSLLKLSKSWFAVSRMQKMVLEAEMQKTRHERERLELEARALRAQMNPHFIYNCMNSIKALIQNDEKQKSIDYLTTFSKLIRTLFNNSDKRQITLFDELETCKLYTQLEAMRLNGKLEYHFEVDNNLDVKSVMVPALILQPFIENAIWHGIAPKESGKVSVEVTGDGEKIVCAVDDNGIGRELSKQNKPGNPMMHQSKGINLSQARLDLEKSLSERNTSVSIIDKPGAAGTGGTRVIIEFNLH